MRKSNFPISFTDKDLEEGNPTTVLKMIHYLIFSSSKTFIQHLKEKKIRMDTQYLKDINFYK